MPRAILLPDALFDADHLGSATSVDNAGTSSRDPTTTRDMLAPESQSLAGVAAAPTGQLVPVALGAPETELDLDLMLRTPGNPDGARWCMRPTYTAAVSSGQNWRGKAQAAAPCSWLSLQSTTASSSRRRPKAIPLASDELVTFYVTGYADSGWGGSAVGWQAWDETNGFGTYNDLGLNVAGNLANATVRAVDGVQFPDTEETVVFVMRSLSSGTRIVLDRYITTVRSNIAGSTNAFQPSVISYERTPARTGQFVNVRAMAVELIPYAGGYRIAMLVHDQGGALWRSYSDDRGVTWQPWAIAGTYFSDTLSFPSAYPSSTYLAAPGAVAMARARTGSLVALSPAIGRAHAAGNDLWTTAASPVMRLLVSDDGDTWSEMIETYPTSGNSDPLPYNSADTWKPTHEGHLFCEGMTEAAIALGDDGLLRVFGALHGDSAGTISTSFYDDLALITFKRPDVTSADIGQPVFDAAATTLQNLAVTTPGCLDALWDGFAGVTRANADASARFQGITPRRIGGANAGAGLGSGNLDATPDFRGVRQVEVVNFRGALWIFICGEDTGQTRYTVSVARACAWTDVCELLPETHSLADFLFGRAYEVGWIPVNFPDRQGWTLTGTVGNRTLASAGKGLRIDNSDTVATYFNKTSLPGADSAPSHVSFTVVPGSGGDVAADNIALRFQMNSNSGGTRHIDVSVRLTTTAIRLYDNIAGATLDTDSGLTLTTGIEVKLRHDGGTTVTVLYRVLASIDPDRDGAWVQLYSGTVGDTASASTANLQWGNQTTTASVSDWREVRFARAKATNSTKSTLQLNDLDGTGFPEFEDDPIDNYRRIAGYDDGTRHASRAPVCVAEPAAYVYRGSRVRWIGSAGVAAPNALQDRWEVASSNAFDPSRVRTAPVSNTWRSNDDDDASFILFDAGTDTLWRPEAVAFFKCNAERLVVQFAATNSWGSPAVSITCDTSDSADVTRHYFRRDYSAGNYTVDGGGGNIVRLVGDATDPLTPHQFRSDDRVTWYLYSSVLNKSARILDNDELRIVLDTSEANSDMTGCNASSEYIAVYPDRIAFPVAGGVLATTGYRWMRVGFGRVSPDTEDLAENYQQCGLFIAGRYVALDDPHPDWGWRRTAVFTRADLDNDEGYVNVSEHAPVRWRWEFGFDFLRPPRDRIASAAPGNDQKSWLRWFAAVAAMRSGEVVGALFPEYADEMEQTPGRTLDLYPVRFRGSMDGAQQAYDGCRTTSDTVLAYLSVQGAAFEEIL